MFGQDFGHRLRELRLAKGLTKEKFCEGDEVLSVRQLTRIETGKSQPKLETLEHLARRLNISLSELLGERAIGSKLPVEYLNLKYQLMHATSLDKPNNLMKLDEKLGKIIDIYYDDLPVDEQRVVDILQSKLYSYTSKTHQKFGMSILEKSLPSLCEKRVYGINDLLLIELYQISLGDGDSMRSDGFSEGTFYTICRNLINSYDNIPTEYLFLLRDALLMVPIVEYERKKFHLSEVAFNQLHRIMEETQDYQKKPILRMLEGQYLYVVKNDIFEAKKAYQEGKILARLLGDTSLADIISEKMRDAIKE